MAKNKTMHTVKANSRIGNVFYFNEKFYEVTEEPMTIDSDLYAHLLSKGVSLEIINANTAVPQPTQPTQPTQTTQTSEPSEPTQPTQPLPGATIFGGIPNLNSGGALEAMGIDSGSK